jgi:hypothetical protein
MIIFDDVSHTANDDGINVPRVSHILQEAGMTSFAGIPAAVLAAACDFGANVHTGCSLFDAGTLDADALDPALVPYITAYAKFKTDYGVTVIHDELTVYSRLWRYCGKLDKYAEIRGKCGIVDLKSGTSVYPATAIQTALYELAAKEEHKLSVHFRMCVQLKGDGTYAIKEYKDKMDLQVGIAAVQTYHWKAKHKLLKGA